MFEKLEAAPPDPILGLTEAFKADPNPQKVNLGVGVYKDASGGTPIFRAVKKAEEKILAAEKTKGYLPISGSPEYAATVQELLFGTNSAVAQEKRAATAHTPGGTGALRLAGDFLKKCGASKIWLSDPTWANHGKVFAAAGLETAAYPYYDMAEKCLDFDAMLSALKQVPAGDVVLLHGCCHNPSGMDPDGEQWKAITETLAGKGIVVLVDLAYQGLGDGLKEDVEAVQRLAESGCDLLVASSFSKNMGLYSERTGALTLVGPSAQGVANAFTHVKASARCNFSNPPSHGGAIVTTVLNDAELRADWEKEVGEIRDRIQEMRRLLVETLNSKGVDRDFSFITTQKGMFSFSGLTKEQVNTLKAENSLYIVGSGRINVAGLTADNMDRVCEAIAAVL